MRKKISIILLFTILGCGAQQIPQQGNSLPHATSNIPSKEKSFSDSLIFHEIGDELSGVLIQIRPLPNDEWLVANLEGKIFWLNKDFQIRGETQVPGVDSENNDGLQNVILSPDFARDHLAYFYYTPPFPGDAPCDHVRCSRLAKYEISLDSDDISLINGSTILSIPEKTDKPGHHGGAMAFSPEGDLLLAIGDGGSPKNVPHDPQDLGSFLGKILEIDQDNHVSIVGSGLRNPFTGVSVSGGFLVGDVGASIFEEANLLPWDGDANFGWPVIEGPFDQEANPDFSEPLFSFHHCDQNLIAQDPVKPTDSAASDEEEGQCGPEIITADAYYSPNQADPYQGALDGMIIYAQPYYGWVRAIKANGSDDHFIAHIPGLVSMAQGSDGFLYGVTFFGRSRVVKLEVVHEDH